MTTARMTDLTSTESVATPSFWLPVIAGLPITLCMVVMGLPDFGLKHFAAFRLMFVVAYIVWSVPLALVQRSLWRRRAPWWFSIPGLLALTYVLSLVNSAIGQLLMVHWEMLRNFTWGRIFSGLDGCWLALIAFCAIHAVVAYYYALRAEERRVLSAVSLARDAELRALRYQLHPHFLFNTLNAISALVVEGRPRDATRVIARLGDFLRATLEGGEVHEVPLADELSLTEHYLDIEKARLGHRLDVRLYIGPDVLRALVPYLLLQPLIENAIRHGIAPRKEGGRMEVHINRRHEHLHLRLRNDGVDAPSEAVDQASRPSGVGLRNVRERLVKLYGEDHRFELSRAVDGSCEVNIELPFRAAAHVAERQTAAR
jgi:two-component system, LytTR family, sensor histidine kinase AlgZ